MLKALTGNWRRSSQTMASVGGWWEIPGVGPICALSFISAIDEPTRFRRNADVGAYLGMVPKIRQSGESRVSLQISKMGCSMTRADLVSAASSHLRYSDGTLKVWGVQLKVRAGKGRARVAVARKLAILMLAMWKSSSSYDPQRAAHSS